MSVVSVHEDEIVLLYNQGLTAMAIAGRFGASKNGILNLLHKRGVKMRRSGPMASQLVADGVHPLVRQMFELARGQNMGARTLARKAGVGQAVHKWAYRSNPLIQNLEACLNVLGYELRIVHRSKEMRFT